MFCFRNLSQSEAPQKTVEHPCPEEEITPKVNNAMPNTAYAHFVSRWEVSHFLWNIRQLVKISPSGSQSPDPNAFLVSSLIKVFSFKMSSTGMLQDE